MADCQNIALRMILVGRARNGKSATANTILGEEKFVSKISAHTVTKNCQKETRKWKGKELLIVDTPGLFHTKETLDTMCVNISQCILSSCPGPHAIIMVLQLGFYTDEDQKTVELIKALFGQAAMKHMIILFTRKEELDGRSLDSFIAEADVNLKSLIQECGNRCYAISNKADKAEKEVQVQELVELIEKMVKSNGDTYFSDAIYKDIEEQLQQHAEILKKTYDDELYNEMKLIEIECAELEKEIKLKIKKHADKLEKEKEEKIKFTNDEYDKKIKNIRGDAEENIFKDVLNKIGKIISNFWKKLWKLK